MPIALESVEKERGVNLSFQLGLILTGAIVVLAAIGMAGFLILVRHHDKEAGL